MGFNSEFKELRKDEDTVDWKKKRYIAVCGELAMEESVDLL